MNAASIQGIQPSAISMVGISKVSMGVFVNCVEICCFDNERQAVLEQKMI